MGKILRCIALSFLAPQQKTALRKLADRRKSFFRTVYEVLSKSEDYCQANMMSRAFGTEVLRRQVESEKQEKAEIHQLIGHCKKAGIAKWRIKLVI